MKLTKLIHGQGFTKNLGNYESLKVYNEVEMTLDKGEDKFEVQKVMRKFVQELNEKDIQDLT